MNERHIKKLEREINSLLQLRNNCIGIAVVTRGGAAGLILSEYSILKLVFILSGIVIFVFSLILTFTVDNEIDLKIKEL